MDNDEKFLIGIIIITIIIGFLFVAPVFDGQPALEVDNGQIKTNIGEEGIGGLDGGGAGDGGEEPSDNEEPTGEPCTYPNSFDIPAGSNWHFVGQDCPDAVKSFFSDSDDVDCFEIESTGNVYNQRNEIVNYYKDYLEELNWKEVDTESAKVNEEDCWAWGGLYYCEYYDKGLIAIFIFCPTILENPPTGVFGQTYGDWDYIEGRADRLNEIIEELVD